jgi:hypothetical protein
VAGHLGNGLRRGGPADPSPVLRPALRVVGIAAAESEFPWGAAAHYDLYTTAQFAAAVNRRAALQYTYYAPFARGAGNCIVLAEAGQATT